MWSKELRLVCSFHREWVTDTAGGPSDVTLPPATLSPSHAGSVPAQHNLVLNTEVGRPDPVCLTHNRPSGHQGVEMINVETIGRKHFNTHGMHLRASGKRFLANMIVLVADALSHCACTTTPSCHCNRRHHPATIEFCWNFFKESTI